MNELEQNIKNECDKYMNRRNLDTKYELLIAFYNPKDKEDSFAYIIDNKTHEEVFSIKPYSNKKPYPLANWDYNIDSYDFENLQDGYKIAYMSLSNHYNFWCVLEQWMPDEIESKVGLQIYLDYCKKNGVTKEVIEYANELQLQENVMKYYEEKNEGYTIIAECTVNGKTIVLAENKNAPSPYATWETTPTRKYGYNAGHYFGTLKEATKDYAIRSKQELQFVLKSQVDLAIQHKNGQER